MQKIFYGFKTIFFSIENIFFQFVDKFLKFELMGYLILHVKFEMCPALSKFPILFSTVKLKLGHNSQFIYKFKIGTFESWS